MSLDLTPAPAPAPPSTRVLRQGLLETSLMMRNGEQLLLALVIPVGLLLGGHALGPRWGLGGDSRAALVGSVLALALWSTAFTSTAIATGFDRRQGVLERLAATPLGRGGLIGGKVIAVVLVTAVQWLALGAVALGRGWHPHLWSAQTVVSLVAVVLATGCFVGFALAMAGALRAEATLGLANLVYLAGLVLGLMVPPAAIGQPWGGIIEYLPTAALGDTLRAWTIGGTHLGGLPILAVWALAGIMLARKVFRWTA